MSLMQTARQFTLRRVLPILTAVLIWKVTLGVVIDCQEYIPPNFESDFLRGREAYFWGVYGWAFYTHLVSGPTSLLLGTLLVSGRLRKAMPSCHRRLGRLQAAAVLCLVAPSGLWMAYYAESGVIAATGLGSLALATAACVVLGWRAAVIRRFGDHQRWMWRTFILLCSAVVIRLIGGLATVTHFDAAWLYPFATWASWLGPLLIYESILLLNPSVERVTISGYSTS